MMSHDDLQFDNPDADWRVTAYVFNQLDEADRAAMEQLMQNDPQYRQAIEQMRAIAGQLISDAAGAESAAKGLTLEQMPQLKHALGSAGISHGAVAARKPISTDRPVHSKSRRRLVALLAIAATGVGVAAWRVDLWSNQQTASKGRSRPSAVAELQTSQDPAPADSLALEHVEGETHFDQGTSDRSLNSSPLETTSSQPFTSAAHEIPPNSPVETSLPVSPQDAEWATDADGFAGLAKDDYAKEATRNEAAVTDVLKAEKQATDFSSRSKNEAVPTALGDNGQRDNLSSLYAANSPSAGGSASSPSSFNAGGSTNTSHALETSGSRGESASRGVGGMPGIRPAENLGIMPGTVELKKQRGEKVDNEVQAGLPLQRGGMRAEYLMEEAREEARFRYARRESERALGDQFAAIVDNAFQTVTEAPLSTFSIDVDTASYSKVRMSLQQYQQLPAPDAVRIEELLNYFTYDYPQPQDEKTPFATAMEVAVCPWNSEHRLARVAIKGREMENTQRAVSNLVFLIDVSGSMNEPNKLPLVRRGLEMLVRQLGENDRVAIVVYAGAAGLVLDSTTADRRTEILTALDRLQAGGSTNGAQGIQLAYQVARDHFVAGGTNRVILCTDGDFNVGTTGTEELVALMEKEAKGGVFLSVLGYGAGNLNDAMLEAISGRGDGNYAFIDSDAESRKVFVEQLTGTLVTIAKDVKIQIEFNPSKVASYRLIGYENRILAARDFNDDTKDAGEIGAGHTVTALYEIVPVGASAVGPGQQEVDSLKYQPRAAEPIPAVDAEFSQELLTLKLRYKQPAGGESQLLEFPIVDASTSFEQASLDFRFAASVASFGMLLRNSAHAGNAQWPAVRDWARSSIGEDVGGLRSEFIGLIDAAIALRGIPQ